MGGHPKWEAPKQGQLRISRNHKIAGKDYVFRARNKYFFGWNSA